MLNSNETVQIEKKPKWKSEVRHTQNLVNFSTLLCFCSSYGATYKPANEGLTSRNLNSLLIMAKTAQYEVDNALSSYYLSIAERDAAFSPIPHLVSSALLKLKASTREDMIIEIANSLVNKIQLGWNFSPRKNEEGDDIEEDNPDTIIAVQTNFDFRLSNLHKFICLLNSVAEYSPFEPELTCSGLTAFYNILKTKNKAVIEAATILNNARVTRNHVLYSGSTGLVDVAAQIKSYIESVFGTASTQYLQVENIDFNYW